MWLLTVVLGLTLMADQRISQVGTEVFRGGSAAARTSQVGTEVFRGGSASQRTSQVGVEVFIPITAPQRVSQVGVEAFRSGSAVARTSQLGVEVFYRRPPFEFTLPGARAGLEGPLVKIRIYNPVTETEHVISTTWISDPADYWGGFAESSLLMVDRLVYGLSDRSGPLQVTTLGFEMSDVIADNTSAATVRGWLGAVDTQILRRCEVWMQMISDPARRRLETPITVFRGYIDEYEGLDQFRMRFTCHGWISRYLDRPALPSIISEVFDGAPRDTRAQRIPLAVGALSDEASSEDPPVFVDDEAGLGGRGGTTPLNSFGHIPGPAAPTNVVAAETTGGNLDQGDVDDDEWMVWATRVVGGVESDPTPFLPEPGASTIVTLTGNNKAIHATCDNDGADAYRFYLAHKAGVGASAAGRFQRCHQFIETTDPVTGVTFTDHYFTNVAGASPAGNRYRYLAALWVMSDGSRTRPSVISGGDTMVAFASSPGYRRPIRFAFDAAPVGAVALEVYLGSSDQADEATQRWTVDVDDPANLNGNGDLFWEWDFTTVDYDVVTGVPIPRGVIEPIYIGRVLAQAGSDDWSGFLISGRPEVTFVSARVGGDLIPDADYNTVVAVPGKGTAWATYFGANNYYLVNGFKLFLVAMRGTYVDRVRGLDREQETLRVNVTGIGGTSIYEQFRLLAKNLCVIDTPTLLGDFDAEPSFSDGTPKVDDAAIDQAVLDGSVAVSAGPTAGRWITGAITVGQLLEEMAIGGRMRIGTPESGQLICAVTNHDGDPVGTIVDVDEVIDRSFGFRDAITGWGNVVPYAFAPRYTADGGAELSDRSSVASTVSIDAHGGQRQPLAEHSIIWRRSSGAARQIAKSILRESEYLPRTVALTSVLHWIHHPLGRIVAVTHREGPQAGGWVLRLVQILGKELNTIDFTVRLTCLDLRRDVGDLTWFQYESFMPTTYIGGSRHDSCVDESGVMVPFNRMLFDIDWDVIPGTHGQRTRIDVRTAVGEVTPAIFLAGEEPSVDVAVVQGTAHDADTWETQTLVIPRPEGNGRVRYWMLPIVGGSPAPTASQVKMFGVTEGYEL
jgi:hypothetical protein